MVIGALGLIEGLTLFGLKLAGRSLFGGDQEGEGTAQGMWLVMFIVSQSITYRGAFIATSWGLSVLGGGIQMKNLKSYKTVLSSCILAMLPCSCFCLLGLPFGIWGLVAINRSDVNREFD
jgi:hypothetical protein